MNDELHRINWSRMVQDLVARSSKKQLATKIGVSEKEVARWIKEEARPQGEHARALREACVDFALNPGKYEGLGSIYAFGKSFDENKDGPEWFPRDPISDFPVIQSKIWQFRPDSPLGIPACVLTANSKWIGRLSKFGFDVFTYKTVRTKPLSAHGLPNLAYVPSLTSPQAVGAFPKTIYGAHSISHDDVGMISLVNSFGMPSEKPDVWQADVAETRQVLASNQILIVSVVGTGDNEAQLLRDFTDVARLAADAKPDAIELNFSCPNVYGKEGSIFHDSEFAAKICKKVAGAVSSVKIIVKIGYLPSAELRSFFKKVQPYIDGVAAINTMSATALNSAQRDDPLFPSNKNQRKSGGVSGVAIREHALSVIQELRHLAEQSNRELMIFAMGGASNLDDVKKFIGAGANCVQLCTAVMFNPLIAVEIRNQWLGQRLMSRSRLIPDSGVRFGDEYIAETITRSLEVARDNSYPAEEVLDFVQRRWLNPYKAGLVRVRESADAPLKARAEAPAHAEIKEQYLADKNARLNAKIAGK